MTASKVQRAPVLVALLFGLIASGCRESARGFSSEVPVVPVARVEPPENAAPIAPPLAVEPAATIASTTTPALVGDLPAATATVAVGGVGTGAPPDTVPGPTRAFTLAFTGDTLMHRPLVDRARDYASGVGFDFAPMFARIAPIISSVDLAVCHLETPVAPPGESLSTFPYYGVPAEVAAGLATAGYDRCSTASNHTFDRGAAGVDATIWALAANGLAQSGMASDLGATLPAPFTVNGVVVAHLSYTFSFNGVHVPGADLWRSNLIDPDRIVADAIAERANGAEYVIVSLHAGREGSSTPNDQQRWVAGALTASGVIDLVVGHHAHVLQPIEQVNGRWVLFGLGNLISNLPTSPAWPASTQDGAIVLVSVAPGPDGALVTATPTVLPTWVEHGGYVVRPVLTDLADPAIPGGLRVELERSLARTTRVLGAYLAPPPTT